MPNVQYEQNAVTRIQQIINELLKIHTDFTNYELNYEYGELELFFK